MILVPVIIGPTASGKTELVNRLAMEMGMEVISVDSRQIYRYMDIGTAKPSQEIRRHVRYHMLDLVEPDQVFSAGKFGEMAREVIYSLSARGVKFLLAGGTGLYIKAIFNRLAELPERNNGIRKRLERYSTEELYNILKEKDKDYSQRVSPADRQRIVRALEVMEITGKKFSEQLRFHSTNLSPIYLGIYIPYGELYMRIERRFDQMIEKGFLDEVMELRRRGYTSELYSFNAMGYRELFLMLEGKMDFQETRRVIIKKIKNYARKQMIWFRKIEGVLWFHYRDRLYERIREILLTF